MQLFLSETPAFIFFFKPKHDETAKRSMREEPMILKLWKYKLGDPSCIQIQIQNTNLQFLFPFLFQ